MTKKKPLRLDHLSFSSLNAYRQCPHRFWFRYLQSAIKPAAILADNVGRRFHEWQESYASVCQSLNVPCARSEGLRLARTYDDPELYSLCEIFCDSWRYDDWAYREGAVEHPFRIPLPDDLPDLIGRFDMLEFLPLDELLRVTDFKTPRLGKQADAPPFQLRAYAFAAQEQRRIETGDAVGDVEVVLWCVATGECQTWRLPYGPQSSIRDEIVMLAKEALTAESYPATPSESACCYCGYKRYCAQAREQRFLAPRNAQAASRLMGKAEVLRAYANDLTKLVQAWATEHGGFECGGQWHDYQPPVWFQEGRHRYKAKDGEKLFAALEEAGEKPWDYLAFDEKKLGKRFYEIAEGGEPDPDNPFGDAEPEALQEVVKQLIPIEPGNTWGKRIVSAWRSWRLRSAV